jgi:cell division ATPase FtsA
MEKENIAVGLDIGTTKIVAMMSQEGMYEVELRLEWVGRSRGRC